MVRLAVDNVDGPAALAEQAPILADLLRQIPGPDRPDYWLAVLTRPLIVVLDNHDREITHLVLAARWVGTEIVAGVRHLTIGVAYVTDPSLLADERLSFSKCDYVAIAMASDISDGKPV